MEPKLRIIRKKKSEAENAHLDPLMRALKALHSAGAPESMTAEELERQRRSQEVLGKLTAPMTGMDYEEFALSGMSAAWTRLKAPHGSRHAILYCHGGGYTSGNLGYSRVLSSKLAHATGYDVLSFEYRLAPEFPYPAAVEDALRAWDYLMLQGYGARDIVLAGDSAGGNLAIVTALALREAEARPAFLLLIYPSTEIRSSRPARERYADGFFLDRESLQWFFERYLPDVDTEDWRVSPMRAASLAGLPPMQVICAECDPLVDDCVAFVERVRGEGGEVALRVFEGVVHGFYTLGKLIPEAREAVALSAAALRAHLVEHAQA